jgi:hypothetical protein
MEYLSVQLVGLLLLISLVIENFSFGASSDSEGMKFTIKQNHSLKDCQTMDRSVLPLISFCVSSV